MHVYYANNKSDSYSQFGVDADLVGMGSLIVGMAFVFVLFFPRTTCATILQPHYKKFLDPSLVWKVHT